MFSHDSTNNFKRLNSILNPLKYKDFNWVFFGNLIFLCPILGTNKCAQVRSRSVSLLHRVNISVMSLIPIAVPDKLSFSIVGVKFKIWNPKWSCGQN